MEEKADDGVGEVNCGEGGKDFLLLQKETDTFGGDYIVVLVLQLVSLKMA